MADVGDPSLEAADNPTPERPEWLPENFKSPEDLARSYSEAQRKITELSQQNKGLEESIGELAAQFENWQTEQNQPDPNLVRNQWLEAFEADPIATVAQIAQTTAQQVHEQYAQKQPQEQVSPDVVAFIADQNLQQAHPDWAEYKQKVAEIVSTDPIFQYLGEDVWRNPASTTAALDRAYKMAKADDVLSGNAVVEQTLEQNRQMKLNAQSASGAAGRPADSYGTWEERFSEIQNAPSGRLDLS